MTISESSKTHNFTCFPITAKQVFSVETILHPYDNSLASPIQFLNERKQSSFLFVSFKYWRPINQSHCFGFFLLAINLNLTDTIITIILMLLLLPSPEIVLNIQHTLRATPLVNHTHFWTLHLVQLQKQRTTNNELSIWHLCTQYCPAKYLVRNSVGKLREQLTVRNCRQCSVF